MRTPTAAATLLAGLALVLNRPAPASPVNAPLPDLGAFSVSLNVQDIAASRAFYETLGFAVVMGKQEQRWLILRNGTTTIGLFQGVFPRNGLTFNPGWNAKAEPLAEFEDVRAIQSRLESAGLTLTSRADEDSTGPASFSLLDPDGNPVLFDQHVPRPVDALDK